MRIVTTIYNDHNWPIRECEIDIMGAPTAEGICADVEAAMQHLLNQWRFGPSIRLKGTEVRYTFKSVE